MIQTNERWRDANTPALPYVNKTDTVFVILSIRCRSIH